MSCFVRENRKTPTEQDVVNGSEVEGTIDFGYKLGKRVVSHTTGLWWKTSHKSHIM